MQDDGRDWYCVLRETKMPAVLIEHGFISNSEDLAKINNEANLDEMAKAVVKAVCDAIPNPPPDPGSDPNKNYDKDKLDKGRDILKALKLNESPNVCAEINREYILADTSICTITAKISNTLSLPNADSMFSTKYNIIDQKFERNLDIKSDIMSTANRFENDYKIELNEIANSINNISLVASIVTSFTENVGSAAYVVENGNLAYSIDILDATKGILTVTIAFNTDLGYKDVYDDTMSLEITYKFKPKFEPPQLKQLEVNPVALYAVALLAVAAAIAAAATPVDDLVAGIGVIASVIIAAVQKLIDLLMSFINKLAPVTT